MEVETPDAPPGEGKSAFLAVLRERQFREAEEAREDELCRQAGEALTGAFHRSIASNALERLYERIVGMKSGDQSGSSRRSGQMSMDLHDDDADEDEYGLP